MKDNKPWYEKVGIWVGIVAGICTVLVFIITLYTMTDTAAEASINIIEDNSNIQDNVQANGDDNITITGNVSGDININTNKSPEINTSSESKTTETNKINYENEKLNDVSDDSNLNIINTPVIKDIENDGKIDNIKVNIMNTVIFVQNINGDYIPVSFMEVNSNSNIKISIYNSNREYVMNYSDNEFNDIEYGRYCISIESDVYEPIEQYIDIYSNTKNEINIYTQYKDYYAYRYKKKVTRLKGILSESVYFIDKDGEIIASDFQTDMNGALFLKGDFDLEPILCVYRRTGYTSILFRK